jgi:hypothetical protein
MSNQKITFKDFLTESALETKTAEELWDENSDKALVYAPNTQYSVKQIPGSLPLKYEVYTVQGLKRTFFGKLKVDILKKTIEPVEPNAEPDAEGFSTYVSTERINAIQYFGDPIKLDLGKSKSVKINDGDYLIRTDDGEHFKFFVEKRKIFEITFDKQKD